MNKVVLMMAIAKLQSTSQDLTADAEATTVEQEVDSVA